MVMFMLIFIVILVLAASSYLFIFFDMIHFSEDHKVRKDLLKWLKEGKIQWKRKGQLSHVFIHKSLDIEIHYWIPEREVSVHMYSRCIMCSFAASIPDRILRNRTTEMLENLIPLRERNG